MYKAFAGLLAEAAAAKAPLWRIIAEEEMRLSELSDHELFMRLDTRLSVMEQSALRALDGPLETVGGLISGVASRHARYAERGGLSGRLTNRVMAYALSCSEVNASMGCICAAPTAGACGILPAVLFGMREEYDLSRGELQLALLTASGVGAVITKNATVSGAEGGCQAECGVAAAMAASAAVFLANGTNEASIHAVAFALMNAMGLVCDPIAGLVQVPCAQRNASQAVNALVAADLALAGMRSVIPPDEVVEAMLKVGHMLPDALKETAQGGIAATPTGKRIAKRIFPEETK